MKHYSRLATFIAHLKWAWNESKYRAPSRGRYFINHIYEIDQETAEHLNTRDPLDREDSFALPVPDYAIRGMGYIVTKN